MSIPSRQEVVDRISSDVERNITAACGRVAQLLNEAIDIPILIKMDVLGFTEKIRSKVAEKVVAAGWKITRQIDSRGWTTEYYEVG